MVIPVALRLRFGIEEEGSLIREEDTIIIRPAVAVPLESYAPENKAAFLL